MSGERSKRAMLRDAITAFRHAERWHLSSRDGEIWEDGWRIMGLAQTVAVLLTGHEIKRRPKQ